MRCPLALAADAWLIGIVYALAMLAQIAVSR
jgi:hypothetical protein